MSTNANEDDVTVRNIVQIAVETVQNINGKITNAKYNLRL
jgi:hypothetical protein